MHGAPELQFSVVTGPQVVAALTGREREVAGVVEAAYRAHGAGRTVFPQSSFLVGPDRPRPKRIGFAGTGVIARYIHAHLRASGWDLDRIGVYDLSRDQVDKFTERIDDGTATRTTVTRHESVEDLITFSDLVVFATVVGVPHIGDPAQFDHNPVVLLTATARLPADRSIVFSPFGMGILDMAVAKYVYDEVAHTGSTSVVAGFFPESRDHG